MVLQQAIRLDLGGAHYEKKKTEHIYIERGKEVFFQYKVKNHKRKFVLFNSFLVSFPEARKRETDTLNFRIDITILFRSLSVNCFNIFFDFVSVDET